MSNSSIEIWDEIFPYFLLRGPGSKDFLHGQTTADVKNLHTDQLVSGCWLNAIGRVRALFEICIDNGEVGVVVLAGNKNEIMEGLSKAIFPADRLEIVSFSTKRRLQKIVDKEIFSPEIIWLESEENTNNPWSSYNSISQRLVDRLLLRQGFPRSSGELNGETNPLELGLAHFISFDKGCYLGQETIAKLLKTRKLKQQLRYWESFDKIDSGECLLRIEQDQKLSSFSRAGIITSSMNLEAENKTIGLALVRQKALGDKRLTIQGTSKELCLYLPKGFHLLEGF